MQPISADQWTRISGTSVGTTTVSTRDGVLSNIVIGADKEGTVTFYDSASGTSDATEMLVLNNNAGSIPTNISVNARLKSGLIAVTGGTTDLTVTWR
jgi:hypothetical protein